MKKKLMAIFISCFITSSCLYAGASKSTPSSTSSSKDSPRIKKPVDETDAYAIPLDSSEMEEDAEQEYLENEAKKPSQRTPYSRHH